MSKTSIHFKTNDVFGNSVSLRAIAKDYDYVLLAFLRYSGCPWCNLAIHRLSLEQARLNADKCQVVAFVQSERDNVIQNIYERHKPKPEFPIIADNAMKFYKQYGVHVSLKESLRMLPEIPYWLQSVSKYGFRHKQIDGNLLVVPAWFLINLRTQKIIKSERNANFFQHETFIDITNSITFRD